MVRGVRGWNVNLLDIFDIFMWFWRGLDSLTIAPSLTAAAEVSPNMGILKECCSALELCVSEHLPSTAEAEGLRSDACLTRQHFQLALGNYLQPNAFFGGPGGSGGCQKPMGSFVFTRTN